MQKPNDLLQDYLSEQERKNDIKRLSFMENEGLIYCEYSKTKTEEFSHYDSGKKEYYRLVLPELTDEERSAIDKIMKRKMPPLSIVLFVIAGLIYAFTLYFGIAMAQLSKWYCVGIIIEGMFPPALLIAIGEIIHRK